MTHVDVALMLGFGLLFAGLLMVAVVLLDRLQAARQPAPPSDAPAVLRKALP